MSRERIEDAAALWVIRREQPGWSTDDEQQLSAWLDESVAHQAAYWRLEHGWRLADGSAAEREADVEPEPQGRRRFMMAGLIALAASLVLAAGLGSLWHAVAPPSPAMQEVATAVGGRTLMALSDGSRIELNTTTGVRASVTARQREVWLDRGEAYFEVRHSDEVPFVVHAGTRTITVLGTKFSVRRDRDVVTVQVVEGRVRVDEVRAGGSRGLSATVGTGDIALGDGRSTLVTGGALERIDSTLAWREGRIVFSGTSLAKAADEFNRYNAKKLVVDDPAVAQIRIGGTFQATNVEAFARLLHQAYGLKIEGGEREIRVAN